MKPVVMCVGSCQRLAGKHRYLLAVCTLIMGCQQASPPSIQDDLLLTQEMKAWFEATDYVAMGFPNLEDALSDIYQDDGYTLSLYNEIKTVLDEAPPNRSACDDVLTGCQEWFELIDYEASGYGSLEEAIEDIYPDDGMTLDLYRRLVQRNARYK